MQKIRDKILKLELVILFLLTIISFLSFYYGEVFPDNFLSISFKTSTMNWFSYYIGSLLAAVGYYVGPWIIFPFIIFSLSYSFFFSKRVFLLDTLSVFFILAVFAGIAEISFSFLLGGGIHFILGNLLSTTELFFYSILFGVIFCAGTFRSSFFVMVKGLFNVICRLPLQLIKLLLAVSPGNLIMGIQKSYRRISTFINLKIPLLLKGNTREHLHKLPNWVASDFDVKNVEELEILKNCKSDQSSKSNKSNKSVESSTNDKLNKNVDNSDIKDEKYDDLVKNISKAGFRSKTSNPDEKYFNGIIERIENKLSEFKIDGTIIEILKGPVVDTFLLELGKGVKVSKVTSSADDLSGALYGAPIRIVYPMRGRTAVGIEVPRSPRELIYLDEVLSSEIFKKSDATLPLAMGKDAFGDVFVVDLATMPHMLVAGATGAGKSVFINTLIVSLLVKRSPSQMKLILIDPKQLELALYAKLPHLIMPVVTRPKVASIALLWAVQEMERRYSILMEFGVRNLDGFNKKLKGASPEMLGRIKSYYDNLSEGYDLPHIVIIVDEFADLILTKAGKEIEGNICRLAGKARAAGIHLILATQRPSVDVITGLIKSNFPTRVSFRVTTSIDSRTILSSVGAEKLLGKGDMLYKRGVETTRVHSAYVDENEIEAMIQKLSGIGWSFNQGAMDFIENGGDVEQDPYAYGSHISVPNRGGDQISDSLYDDAVKIVMEHRSASASMLQRRLKIGYNRAANLVEEMERRGIVGPAQGAKPRKVLSPEL